jgi:hypothetical protein
MGSTDIIRKKDEEVGWTNLLPGCTQSGDKEETGKDKF